MSRDVGWGSKTLLKWTPSQITSKCFEHRFRTLKLQNSVFQGTCQSPHNPFTIQS